MNALIIIFLLSYFVYAAFNNARFLIIYFSLIAIYYYLTQVKFFQNAFNSLRRKIQIATWGSPFDPQIYGKLKINLNQVEPYLEEISKEIGEKVTLTIYIIKLISLVLKKYPEISGCIRLGKYVNKENVDVCCLVQVGNGQDLANTTIRACETKDFSEIVKELKDSVEKLRAKKNKAHNQKQGVVKLLPTFILAPVTQMVSYLSSIGMSFKLIGMPKYEFGTCVVTSIGSLGIDDGYPPIPSVTFVPMLISICKKKTKFIRSEIDNKIEEDNSINLNFTLDHRFIAIKDIAKIYNDEIGENPRRFEEEMNKYLTKKDQ